MNHIERFRFDGVDLVQHEDGRWVRYEDHAAQNDRLREALKDALPYLIDYAIERGVEPSKDASVVDVEAALAATENKS